MKKYTIFTLLLMLVFISCKKGKEKITREFHFDFSQNAQGWQGFFSDYPTTSETSYELEFAHAYFPAPLDEEVKAIKISGNNHSDDLLSLIVKKIDSLTPNAVYNVTFNIDLASNVTINSPGIGGSPDLEFGAGGIAYQPENNINLGYYRPNFTNRLQSHESNEVLKSNGRIGVSTVFPAPYTLINRNNLSSPIPLRTNAKGELWLMIGTDSGFEGVTTLYYKSIKIRME